VGSFPAKLKTPLEKFPKNKPFHRNHLVITYSIIMQNKKMVLIKYDKKTQKKHKDKSKNQKIF